MTDTWRGTYSERFLNRAIQRPPQPPVYRRLTDEEIAVLPDAVRPIALLVRSFNDACAEAVPKIARLFADTGRLPPASVDRDALARREWPHVPLSLSRAYADEYVRTGQKP